MAEPSYSRNELVSELTSYYEFLTRLFLPPEVVQHPPEGGWEHITPDFVKSFCLGKNDTVADLMRHIPYVSRTKEDHWDPWMVYEGATAVDFTGDVVLSLPTKYADEWLFEPYEGSISTAPLPPHVFVYATIPSGRDGHYILIDTERGTIVLADPQTGPKPTGLSDPHRTKKPGADFKPTQFTSFFAMAKEKFKKFEMTAMNRKQIYYTTRDTPHAQIYREEGVFTKRYDRERCMNRLDEYQEQKDRANRQNRGEEEPASASAERHIHDVGVSSGAVS
ncbi:hypothetical protein CTAM01_06264 [Colletotrichum tamarilloi]|uniref:Uncharacterized protein n=1 Tax=Colletotrichum tamarilloi TaxID=1209934 RepID=A0ABQ9RC69_9PEZI|nr:uncharacterized protein CTAM01_06264 [Colletotrichum tamarilloi]KAK1500812.1 hypothetical protein CTAM01_06264 [Colletotrichum tamarilloi]